MLSLSFRLEPDDDHDDALSERATTTDDNDDVVDSSSLFFLCFDASVLKNENNIRELTYDDHCSDRHNSRSLMLLAFFSSDASKQKNTTSRSKAQMTHKIKTGILKKLLDTIREKTMVEKNVSPDCWRRGLRP